MSLKEAESSATSTVSCTVFVLDVTDHFAHLFTDVDDLLSSHATGAHEPSRGLEFFDQDGCRLAPVFDSSWTLVGLVKAGDKAEPELVRSRLVAVVDFLAEYIRSHPEEVAENYGLTVNEALAELPDLAGKTLAESVVALGGRSHQAAAAVGDQQDSGSWFHNLMHKL